jgi:Domain of unknown function (DUF4157)
MLFGSTRPRDQRAARASVVQRQDALELEARILADAFAASEDPPSIAATSLEETRRLPPTLVYLFSRTLGLDVSHVRVHIDDRAAESALAREARAFACGGDVFFARGEYRPHTRDGLRLLAHELVHVAQQGALPSQGIVRLRTTTRVQSAGRPSPAAIYGLCRPGTTPTSYPSSGPIGTAYGQYLGLMYMHDRMPKTYGIVDWLVYTAGDWIPGTIYSLWSFDTLVAGALATTEWTRGFLARRERTDILDSDRDHVYEIKPVRSRADGPAQLASYLATLRALAPTTSATFGPPRARSWRGGDWDPRPYPLVVPGVGGELCFIHAWRDETTPGLLVYDIVCCKPTEEQPGDQPVLAATKLKRWERHFDALRPAVEDAVRVVLPKAPIGSAYAVLVPWRFFEVFVLPQWTIELDRQLEKAFSVRVNPALVDLILGTWAASQVLPTRHITNAIWMSGPWMNTKQLRSFYKAELIADVVGGVVGGLGLFVGPAVLGEAAVAEAIVEAEAVDVLVADAAAAEALAVDETLAVEGLEAAAEGALINGLDVAAAVNIGQSVSPITLAAVPAGATTSQLPAGVGTLGALLVGAFATNAEAAASGTPTATPTPKPIGVDPVQLAPVELVHPYRGKIDLAAKVEYGGRDYVIAGIVTAETAP